MLADAQSRTPLWASGAQFRCGIPGSSAEHALALSQWITKRTEHSSPIPRLSVAWCFWGFAPHTGRACAHSHGGLWGQHQPWVQSELVPEGPTSGRLYPHEKGLVEMSCQAISVDLKESNVGEIKSFPYPLPEVGSTKLPEPRK